MKQSKTIWVTREGKKIKVKDMTDSHLLNSIKYLDRRLESMKITMPYPNFNGEMAQFCAEQDWDHFQNSEPSDYWPIYETLCKEISKRGLDA